jgi:DNA-directed RNA polymerase subunit N (RpoN/RPB10)
MVFPIRCFTCNKVFKPNLFDLYLEKIELGYPQKEALDMFGVYNQCCRSIIQTTVSSELEDEYISLEK